MKDDRILDEKHERFLEARYEKQTMCIAKGKRCAECDGLNEYDKDEKCPYKS